MKNLKLIMIATCLMAWCVSLMSLAQQNVCGTYYLHNHRMQTDPAYAADYLAKQAMVNQNLQQATNSPQNATVTLSVPVVVHVVHLGEALGTGNNISDANIINIINDLNNKFANSNGNGVNMNIQFCLAVRDPNNVATTGITRHNGSGIPNYSTGGVDYYVGCGTGVTPATIKALSNWPSSSYLNIWLVKSICGASAFTDGDGCFLYASTFNSTSLPVLAHEVGHWFGLSHVYNDADPTVCPPNVNCAVDGDGVCDTPPVILGDCNTSTCNLGGYSIYNSTQNYMYIGICTPTLAWDRFTQGQKDKVWAGMPVYHSTLSSSLGCVPLTPNDAGISAIVNPTATTYNTLCGGANYNIAPVVKLTNYGTSALTSVSIKYKIDNNAASTYSWSGSLAAFTTANVTLPSVSIPQGAHTFQAYTTLPNGAADGYNNNDSSSTSVTITGPTAITATTSQTNTTCAGNNGTATVNPSGGTLQTTVNNLTDFESAHGWTIVNGSQQNIWCAGTAAPYAGSNSIYISSAANACANNNSTGAQFATVHFYKDFTFPANASNIQLKFYWRNASGVNSSFQVDSSDYFETYLVGTGITPAAGAKLLSGKLSGKYSNNASWTQATVGNLDANAGTTKRLVFTWDNDWYATNPAGNIDNINVSYTQTFTYAYLWSNAQTTQTATGLAPGTYTCTITDANGCTTTKSVTILNGCAGVTISAGGPTTFCQGGSVVLTSSLPTGNIWSTGATTQSITVTTSGNYSCTNSGNTSNTITVTVNPIPATPTVTAGGPLTFCQGGSVTLTSSSATGNTWSPGGATTQSINVTSSGSYTVTVTTNGCTSSPSAAKVVTVNPIPATPTISAGGPTTFCTGGSVTLTSSSASGNLWSTGATTQSISATTSGNYTVAVTSNGCTSSPSAATTVTVQVCGSVTITAGGPTTFCSGGNVVLTSSIATGNVWSTGATTQSITVTTSGSYNCTNGGSTSNTIAVTVNPSPVPTTSQTGTVSLCSGSLINGPASGNAAILDGVDDNITIANNISTATAFTFELWVYPLSSANSQRLLQLSSSASNYMYCAAYDVSGKPRFGFSSGGGTEQVIPSAVALTANAWNHLAVTLTGGVGKIYINGNLTGTNATMTVSPATIGATTNNFLGNSTLFGTPINGYIDEVRFWNVARTQAQIQSNMNKAVSNSASGLVAYYRLDENSGTQVLESVSGSTTATANNGTSWLVPSTVPWNAVGYLWSNGVTTQSDSIIAPGTYTVTVTAVNGCTASSAPVVVTSIKPVTTVTITAGGSTTLCTGQTVTLTANAKGNALLFDGNNDYAEVPNPMIPTSGSYSILFWAKETVAQGGFREIVSQGRNFYLGRDNTGIIRVGDNWLNTGVAWPTDLQWHHYAVVRSGSNTYLYVDGNLAATKGSAIGSPVVVSGTPNNFVIGDQFAHGIGENFGGQVDEITIWSNQRTQAQIQALMSNPPNITASGLVAYYKLDEGTGGSAVDAVSNANAAILTNGPTWVVPSSIASNIASYLWSTTATTQGITVGTKSTYKVTVTNNAGCTSTATKKVYTSIPKATITVTGSLQLCGGSTVTFTASSGTGYTYQWTKNGNNIGGATNQVYVANSAGIYKVIVTNADGCTKMSGGKTVSVCARFGDVVTSENDDNLSVYPNPTFDFVNISFESEDASAELQIININGDVIIKKQVESTEGSYEEPLDVSALAPGMYMIQLRTHNKISSVRFVKQ